MKKIFLFYFLLLGLTLQSQDFSPGGITNALLLNANLDNIYYDNFLPTYGKPDKTIKEESGESTLQYNFVNKTKNMRQEVHFINNEYGKVTSILYHFPASFRANVEKTLNSKLSIIMKDVWYNSTRNLIYTFVDLSKIGITSDNKDVVILMISIYKK